MNKLTLSETGRINETVLIFKSLKISPDLRTGRIYHLPFIIYHSLNVFFLLLFCRVGFSQCDLSALSVINTANAVLTANAECTDNNGWTHYFHSGSGKILLSIKKNGQNIGAVGLGLTVKSGTLGTYGSGGYNLSNADYIDNDIWIVSNRYWQITGANAISSPIRIRYYFDDEDVTDVFEGVDDFGFWIDEPSDLYMFTIGNTGGLYPLSTMVQGTNGNFTLYDMAAGAAPDWAVGTFNGGHYAEFDVTTSDVGGGGGLLIFLNNVPVSISGNIAKANGTAVPQVTVSAASASVGISNAAGNYACPTLLSGGAYEVTPEKDINPAEYLSVVDLIAISRHVLGLESLNSPYKIIAADANKNAAVANDDLTSVRNVLLGNAANFPNNKSWRFVPESYVFPVPGNPFSPAFPEKIVVPNLGDSLFNQDFTGIKTGDVADPSTAVPPSLNTGFALPALDACNNGDIVTFPLTVQDFQGIRGFQFTLEWDETVLHFEEISGLNLPGLSLSGIGTSAASEGKLTFAWFNPASSGSSLADGAAICQLKFSVNGFDGDATPLTFNGSATPALVVFQNLSEDATPTFSPGNLTVENFTGMSATALIDPAGCLGEPTGSLDMTLSGQAPPVSYLWSNGATSEDLSNLSGGTYRVTVTDGSGNCPLVKIFVVTPTGPVMPLGTTTDMNCPGMANGSIDLDVQGGTPPFSYAWSNGATAGDLSGLYFGGYSVTVTDAEGCSGSAAFSIGNPNLIAPNVSIMNAYSETAANGAVTVNYISGGLSPFSFMWSTGAVSQSIEDLMAGDYFVTITDGIGCQHVFGYLVNVAIVGADKEQFARLDAGLSPNPSGNGSEVNLLIDSELAGETSVTIFAVNGQLTASERFVLLPGQTVRPLRSPDVPGVYFVKIQVEEGAVVWLKMVVR